MFNVHWFPAIPGGCGWYGKGDSAQRVRSDWLVFLKVEGDTFWCVAIIWSRSPRNGGQAKLPMATLPQFPYWSFTPAKGVCALPSPQFCRFVVLTEEGEVALHHRSSAEHSVPYESPPWAGTRVPHQRAWHICIICWSHVVQPWPNHRINSRTEAEHTSQREFSVQCCA